MDPRGDTGKSTGAIGKDDGTHPKNEYKARLYYDAPSFKNYLNTDPKSSPTAFPLPEAKEYHFLVKGFMVLVSQLCSNGQNCTTYDWQAWHPDDSYGMYSLSAEVRLVLISPGSSPSDYLFKDFILDGKLHSPWGSNLDVDLPWKPGDQVNLYFIDGNDHTLNTKEWKSFSENNESYSDFTQEYKNGYMTDVYFMGAFTYPKK
jgi:hypothetical protein